MANTTGKKFGGRTKGTPNKCTSKTKELLSDLIMGQTDRIQEALDEVFECNKKEYLNVMIRLIPYVMPKATEVESEEAENGRKLYELVWRFCLNHFYLASNSCSTNDLVQSLPHATLPFWVVHPPFLLH